VCNNSSTKDAHCAKRTFCAGGSYWCCSTDGQENHIGSVEEVRSSGTKNSGKHGMPFDRSVAGGGFADVLKDGQEGRGDSFDADDADATTADTTAPSMLSPNGKLNGASSGSSKECPWDFGGSWICTGVSGNMEAFLTDMGLNDQLRSAAATARYGVGRQVQNIAQVGDSFVIQNILKAPVTMRFRVGGGVQGSLDQEGKPIVIEPRWDETGALHVTSKRESGELIAHTRRFFEGEMMVLELTSPLGTVVKRAFERR